LTLNVERLRDQAAVAPTFQPVTPDIATADISSIHPLARSTLDVTSCPPRRINHPFGEMAREMHTCSMAATDKLATAFKGNEAMTLDSDFLCNRSALEQFLTVLHRLWEDTRNVVESGPTTIELVGGYLLLIDPADSSSGFVASVHFAPPGTDGVMIAEHRFQGGKADLSKLVIQTLCDDVPNLNDRLRWIDR
jgi:hypothetical protein